MVTDGYAPAKLQRRRAESYLSMTKIKFIYGRQVNLKKNQYPKIYVYYVTPKLTKDSYKQNDKLVYTGLLYLSNHNLIKYKSWAAE